MLSRIVSTNQPPITNKGKVEITELGIGVTTNRKEEAHIQILPTTLEQTSRLKIPNNPTHLDEMIHYGQISHANYATSTGTIHMSAPSWVTLRRFFRTKLNTVLMW